MGSSRQRWHCLSDSRRFEIDHNNWDNIGIYYGERSMARLRRSSIHMATVLCFAAWISTGLGCAQANMLRDQAILSGRALGDAVAPIFDPAGGSVTPEGRSIERSLSRSGGY